MIAHQAVGSFFKMVWPCSVVGIPQLSKAQVVEGRATPLLRGVWRSFPRKFKMSVKAILMHFEAIFSCEMKLILQAFTVFQMLTTAFLNPHH